MKLHLDDPNLAATLDWIAGDRVKLTVVYPCEASYSLRVASAMEQLLKPAPRMKRERGSTDV